VPIVIDATLWGVLVIVGRRPLPRGIEDHLANFADLVGTAIAAAEARIRLRALADEQTALRRVAELLARGATPDEVFAAVATEASALLGGLPAVLLRYDGDEAVAVATCNSPAPLGLRVPASANTATGHVFQTGLPARVDTFEGTALAHLARRLGVASGVAVPITVEGRVRATLTTSSPGPPLPADTETRLAQFAELAAVAMPTPRLRPS
jgi:GAF domain-containing protein